MALVNLPTTAGVVPISHARRRAAARISYELIGRFVLLALAAFAVLVLLPAAIAAQAASLI